MAAGCAATPFPFRAWPILLAAVILWGCAGTPSSTGGGGAVKSKAAAQPDKLLARLLSNGDVDGARNAADSLMASKLATDREIGAYWSAMYWLYRDNPDSALVILERNQSRWTGGMRKVHTGLFLRLTRESSQNRSAEAQAREEGAKIPPDKAAHDRVEFLHKENIELRSQIGRLETEMEKYRKLLKDLETIR